MIDSVTVWENGKQRELSRDQCFFTDRSRINTSQTCPAKRWFQYHAGPEGRGLVPSREGEDLVLGRAVHAGMEVLLAGTVEGESIDAVCQTAGEIAANHFRRESEAGLEMQDSQELWDILPEVAQTLRLEQGWLAYALVWAWGKRKLAKLLEEYEVLAIEPEINWPLGQLEDGRTAVMMSRPDAVLRRIVDGSLWTVSWKTAKRFDQTTLSKLECDTQTLTEGLAVQHWTGKPCRGTYYGYLVKGDKQADEELGAKRYASSLIRPYHRDAAQFGGNLTDFRAAYKWFDGTVNRTLGKGWSRVNIWDWIEPLAWLEALERGEVQPEAGRDWLGESIVEPMPQRFDRISATLWQVQALFGEEQWATHPEFYSRSRHHQSCFNYSKTCTAFGVCWRGETVEDRLLSGRWVPRTANHESEFGGEE